MAVSERWFGRAVVVGGSIAGLVGARVLSDYFEHVTIVERDPRPEGPEPRKGAPQMRHVHVALEIAVNTLHLMFPDLIEWLDRAGAFCPDSTAGL